MLPSKQVSTSEYLTRAARPKGTREKVFLPAICFSLTITYSFPSKAEELRKEQAKLLAEREELEKSNRELLSQEVRKTMATTHVTNFERPFYPSNSAPIGVKLQKRRRRFGRFATFDFPRRKKTNLASEISFLSFSANPGAPGRALLSK